PAQWQTMSIGDDDMAADLAEALTFQKYPTYAQYLEMMQYFEMAFPEICRLDTFGTSVEGRQLLVLKISDHADAEEPEADIFYTSTIHGDEPLGMVLLLRLASTLLEGYGTDAELTGLVDSLAIWINPLSNPDGTYSEGGDVTIEGAVRFNAEGTDLNRDFPDAGVELAADTAGRATETRAMMALLQQHRFTLSANLHSGAEVVNYPWDHTYALHADDNWFRFVSREYADEAKAVDPGYMSLFTNGITNGAEWYPVSGGRQDYVTWFLEGRELTLELSNTKLVASEFLEGYWQVNHRSLLNYLAQCTYGLAGTVTDAKTGDPVRARIYIPDHDSIYSQVHSTALYGDFYRPIKEGTYEVVAAAPGYLNDTLVAIVADYALTPLRFWLTADEKSGVAGPEVTFFRLYPNPCTDLLFVDPGNVPYGEVRIEIHSISGFLLKTMDFHYSGAPLVLHLEELKQGTYIIRMISQGSVCTGRVVRMGP
ncbi:MAG: M14 family zinc carboxypeptidase, partial [Bacteroidales bacterium]